MMFKIDLNSDLGESFGPWRMGMDREVMEHVSSANVACGFHAGDPEVMIRTVQAAKEASVAVGAHPGHPDFKAFFHGDDIRSVGRFRATPAPPAAPPPAGFPPLKEHE